MYRDPTVLFDWCPAFGEQILLLLVDNSFQLSNV